MVAERGEMNGDSQKIYDEIVSVGNRMIVIETQQKERHIQNRDDMKKLHKTISSVIKLKTHVNIQWWFIGGIFIGIIGLFIKGLNA